VATAQKISLAKESLELDTAKEQEMSKENSISSITGPKVTTPCGLHYYDKYRKTLLPANNMSNTNAHSRSLIFAVGNSSKGRLLVNKQAGNIVVSVESFISKHTLKPALEGIREKKEEDIKSCTEKEEDAWKKRKQVRKMRGA
jgi:hypothetical protein